MKLIKQKKLFFKEGKSDKVYEVDLCEVEDGMYVVNFRYGRRGGNLKEGTKTVIPVSGEKAEDVFNNLVLSKTKKGYKDIEGATTSTKTEESTIEKTQGRKEKIIHYINEFAKGKTPTNWKLSRILWRGGELNIEEAAPKIKSFLLSEDFYIKYSACFALAKLKHKDSKEELLEQYNRAKDDRLKRASLLALLTICDEQEFEQLLQKEFTSAYDDIKVKLANTEKKNCKELLTKQILNENNPDYQIIWLLYLLSYRNDFIHNALQSILRIIPLKVGYFKYLRYIYKAAEFFGDYHTYATLAYRFENSKESFSTSWGGTYYKGEYIQSVDEELKKTDSRLAYSSKTRSYLKLRVLRILNRLGIDGNDDYTSLATEILLSYNDNVDKAKPKKVVSYSYDYEARSYSTVDTHYDVYAHAVNLNFILHQNSTRYQLESNKKKWVCSNGFEPGGPVSESREEAFPELWNNSKENILRLLTESQVSLVHEFAVKVFKANPSFYDAIEVKSIIALLTSGVACTINLGVDIAKGLLEKEPNTELLSALFLIDNPVAHELALEIFAGNTKVYENDLSVFAATLCCTSNIVDELLKDNLPKIDDRKIDELVQLLTANLLIVNDSGFIASNRIFAILSNTYNTTLRNFSQTDKVETLIETTKPQLLILAAAIIAGMKDNETFVSNYLPLYLNSTEKDVREKGVFLLKILPDSSLRNKSDLLASFCISEHEDIRVSAKSLIVRLANYDRSFSDTLIENILPVLFQKEKSEGLHDYLLRLFTEELPLLLSGISNDDVVKMLNSKFEGAQRLGVFLYDERLLISKIPLNKIIDLASCDILTVRESVWDYFNDNKEKIKRELNSAYKIVDAKWEDSRLFAFSYFKEHFTDKDWNTDVIIAICDSVLDDVQTFGRYLATQFFKSEHGNEYLIKLSQHPGQNLQLFCSNFIEQYAKNDFETLKKLEHYFRTVLGQVNKGRVAKTRAFNFLKREITNGKEQAQFIANIINEISLTIALQDKSECIDILHSINLLYPDIKNVLKAKEVEQR